MAQEAQKALTKALEAIRQGYKEVGNDADELADRICKSFQNAFDRPPVDEFEQILQKNMTPDEVRVALFAPHADQIKYYPLLLHAGSRKEVLTLGETHPLARLKALVLSTIFLLHRHSWKDFLEEFVVRGGLATLADMLIEPNLYFRGQVVEIFLTITDADVWDWFSPRSDLMGRTLHIRFLELSESPAFLSNLCANRTHSYPGGSMRCLQLMAFWLSWVRALYTKNQLLQLSPQLLSELALWKETDGTQGAAIDVSLSTGDAAIDAETESTVNAEAAAEEARLAETLWKDFGNDQFQRDECDISDDLRAELERIKEANNQTGLGVDGIARPAVDDDVKSRVSEAFQRVDDSIAFAGANKKNAAAAPVMTEEEREAAEEACREAVAKEEEDRLRALTGRELRERGNAAFGRGDYVDALQLYDFALAAVAVGRAGAIDGGDLSAPLHFNSAACYWKIYQKKRGDGSNKEGEYMTHALLQATSHMKEEDVLRSCEKSCRAAIAIDRSHFKAGYRLGASLLALGHASDGLEAVTAALAALAKATPDASTDASYTQLRELRTRCMAATMLGAKEGNSSSSSVSKRTAGVLAALQRRKQREDNRETHALSSTYQPPTEQDLPPVPTSEDDSKAAKKKLREDSEETDVSAYFGAGNVYTGSSDKKRVASGGKKKPSATPVVPVTPDEEVARKAKRVADKKAIKKRLQGALAALKKSAAAVEKAKFSVEAMDTQQTAILTALEEVWTSSTLKGNKYTLATAFDEAGAGALLEESTVVAVIMLAQRLCAVPESAPKGLRCAIELTHVERFSSVLGMSLYGNEELKKACAEVAAALEGQGEQSDKAAALLRH